MEYIAEAALRSLTLAVLVRLGIAGLRITSAQQEKIVWTTLLAGALTMPLLVRWPLLPSIPIATFSGPTMAISGSGLRGATLASVNAVYIAYLSISSLLLLRMLSGAARMLRMRARAQRIREPWTLGLDVRVARELAGPATFGATILLPPGYVSWPEAKRCMILRHEAAHVRHHDSQIQWVAGLHLCLFWFSPLAWWLRARLAKLAEFASDDDVLRQNACSVDYAAVLLEEAQTGAARPMLVGITTNASHTLAQRVDRILSTIEPAQPPSRSRRALAVLSVLPFVALAAAGVGQQRPVGLSQQSLPQLPTSEPFITTSPSEEELQKFYPERARAQGIDGLVQITVTLDEDGRATDTFILSETPTGLGFGAAASELAHQFRYANPTAGPATLTFKIKFALDHGQGKDAEEPRPCCAWQAP